LVTSRGCPFDCEFCSVHPVCGHVWRARSAESVVEEITYLVERHSVDSLEFEDDNFTLKRDRTVAILEGIIRLNEKGANLKWRTPNGLRIDTLDEGVIELIKRSGCKGISLALEHGDEEVLRIMNKKLDLEKAFDVLRMSVKHKIKRIDIFVIVGYPGETRERFKNSLRYLKRIKKLRGKIVVNVFFAQPHPGTRLLRRCIAEGYVNNADYSNFLIRRDLMSTANDVSITTPDFDEREVMRRKKRILRMFR
jgi:anaerobic magnesium-protoporphyrin IX monomethyl ester cyclase